MKTKKKITIAYADDWEGIYIDGVLAYENHSISLSDIQSFVDLGIDSIPVDTNWLEERGNLPINMEDIKQES